MQYPIWQDAPARPLKLEHGAWWDVPPERPVAAARGAVFSKPEWARQFGVDDFGAWAEFDVPSPVGPITQRMRFIPPGEFLMGSPESEAERSGDETQHQVLLTKGYWLADTACTQALWQAVMGDNPSNFKDDPASPVEQVSWQNITENFLPALNRLVPGLDAVLPSEAQWENACRAGTTTPFSFGEQITPEQVNYDGNVPYAEGEKGKYREKTVSVKSLSPNAWGLHEMHGNVWEWCLDGLRGYEVGTAVDPVGPQDQRAGERVLRGGGWIFYGRDCRSAYRLAYHRDARNDGIGFRLARGLADRQDGSGVRAEPASGLRSAEREAGAVASAGAAAPADARAASRARPPARKKKR
jgi:formylglycine-generating enzyme required for sulfatase activity